jgi:hypothetical protein
MNDPKVMLAAHATDVLRNKFEIDDASRLGGEAAKSVFVGELLDRLDAAGCAVFPKPLTELQAVGTELRQSRRQSSTPTTAHQLNHVAKSDL